MEGELLDAEGAAAPTRASTGVQLEEGREEALVDLRGRDPFEADSLTLEAPREASELPDEAGRRPGAPSASGSSTRGHAIASTTRPSSVSLRPGS
jgi:hypothetical protein